LNVRAILFIACAAACCNLAAAQALVPFQVVNGEIRAPLTATPGDPARGRLIASDRNEGACVLCHVLPDVDARAGNIGPALAGVGSRLSAGQLRLRVVDPTRLQPDTVMPAYYRVEGLHDVAAAYRGKPVLTAQQVEDVVAYLGTLKQPSK